MRSVRAIGVVAVLALSAHAAPLAQSPVQGLAPPQAEAPPEPNWRNIGIGGGGGMYSPVAESWECITGTCPQYYPVQFDAHPKDSRIIYLAAHSVPTPAGKQGGVYKTVDGGKKWERLMADEDFSRYPFSTTDYVHCYAPAIHPENPDVVLLTTGTHGLFYSTDAGRTWKPDETFPVRWTRHVAWDPKDDRRFAGERLPLFEEVLEFCKLNGVRLTLDIKVRESAGRLEGLTKDAEATVRDHAVEALGHLAPRREGTFLERRGNRLFMGDRPFRCLGANGEHLFMDVAARPGGHRVGPCLWARPSQPRARPVGGRRLGAARRRLAGWRRRRGPREGPGHDPAGFLLPQRRPRGPDQAIGRRFQARTCLPPSGEEMPR